MIRAVFFDVDDTLVDFTGAARTALTEVLGEQIDHALWEEASRPHWERYHRGEVEFERMRVERTADFLRQIGRAVTAAEAEQIELRRMALIEQRYLPFTDVEGCLTALAGRGLRLGLISNNDGQHQLRKLAATRLRDHFEVLVFSGDVGVAKPDPAIFLLACERAGVRPDEAVHVGDLIDADARGANNAGLRGIWLDRAAVGGADSDVTTINALDELADLF